jgi:two-component system, chemotaxis family, sensor kinase CheA
VDFTDIETLCQSLESLFASWKRDPGAVTATTLDTAHLAHDRMAETLNGPAAARSPPPILSATSPPPLATAAPMTTPTSVPVDQETVRVAVRALDERLLEAEELLMAKITAAQRSADLDALAESFNGWRKEWTRVHGEARVLRSESGHPLAEFLEWNHEWMRALEARVDQLRRNAGKDRLAVGKLVDDLLANSKKLLMLPVSTLTAGFPKLARDLTRELGKDADLVIRGEEVQVDKRILEEMKDPLTHLLRNAIDHGIESPAARRQANKSPRATLTLTVTSVDGSQVEISVADDGAGIDRDAVKAQAIKRGLVSAESVAAFGADAALALVFEADLSTSPMVTQVSGRGLGLAIVREKTEKLGGRLSIESVPGAGTTVRMTLPLTLATFRGVLVESARRTFVVPTAQVERVTRFRSADVRTVEGRDTLEHNGMPLALASLAHVLDLPAVPVAASETTPALILGTGADRIAFAVDAVLDEREVLVKTLAKPLLRIRNVAGATVLGDGAVAPILNVTDLLRSARRAPGLRLVPRVAPAVAAITKRVLVAEDSITSRMLIKGILESAGYAVKTAVDGLDAFTQLRTGSFDVLVSDVEMPRLNGFDLTARVRADAELGSLPVVLVTALASREDRERGIEVGANAYLVKSNLDQSNLLEALERLA